MMTWLADHIGRRGNMLLLMGCVWVFMGLSLIFGKELTHPAEAFVLHQSIPPEIRGLAWIGSGATAITCAFLEVDRIGFAGLTFMPALRCGSFGTAWFASLIPGGEVGLESGWSGLLVWGVIILVIVNAAGWAEPLYRHADVEVVPNGQH